MKEYHSGSREIHQQEYHSLAQYVVIQRDLIDSLNWPFGSLLTQACHASVAAIWIYKDHPHTLAYCNNLDHMTTVTLEVYHPCFGFSAVGTRR